MRFRSPASVADLRRLHGPHGSARLSRSFDPPSLFVARGPSSGSATWPDSRLQPRRRTRPCISSTRRFTIAGGPASFALASHAGIVHDTAARRVRIFHPEPGPYAAVVAGASDLAGRASTCREALALGRERRFERAGLGVHLAHTREQVDEETRLRATSLHPYGFVRVLNHRLALHAVVGAGSATAEGTDRLGMDRGCGRGSVLGALRAAVARAVPRHRALVFPAAQGKPVRTVAAPPVPGLVSGLRPTLDLPRPGLRRPSLKTEATRPTVDGGNWGPALISTSHDSTDGPRSACAVDQASANGSSPRRSSTGPGKAPLVHSLRPPTSRCGSAGAAPGPAVPSALSSSSASNARPSTASSDSMDGSPSG